MLIIVSSRISFQNLFFTFKTRLWQYSVEKFMKCIKKKVFTDRFRQPRFPFRRNLINKAPANIIPLIVSSISFLSICLRLFHHFFSHHFFFSSLEKLWVILAVALSHCWVGSRPISVVLCSALWKNPHLSMFNPRTVIERINEHGYGWLELFTNRDMKHI